jgi:hypothetical protein
VEGASWETEAVMQEHRQLIKRASTEVETAGQASTNFENTLGLLRKVFNEAIYEGALCIL